MASHRSPVYPYPAAYSYDAPHHDYGDGTFPPGHWAHGPAPGTGLGHGKHYGSGQALGTEYAHGHYRGPGSALGTEHRQGPGYALGIEHSHGHPHGTGHALGTEHGRRPPVPPADHHRSGGALGIEHSPGNDGSHRHRHRRHRSRSNRRDKDLRSVIVAGGVEQFRRTFNSLPKEFQAIAFEPPEGIIVDTKSIKEDDARIKMCMRINELRRERLLPLAAPQNVKYYQAEGTKILALSKIAERHFWDLFRKIPIGTTNVSQWKNVLRYVDDCPEKPLQKEPDAATCDFGDGLKGQASAKEASPPRRALPLATGMEALRAMATNSPIKPGGLNDRAIFLQKAVESDTANMSWKTIEINKGRCLPKKTSPEQALKALPGTRALSEEYQVVYQIYLRKFSKLLEKVTPRSAEGKALTALCNKLNIDISKGNSMLDELLARLRALDMVERPM